MPDTTNNNNRPIATKGTSHVAAATSPDVHTLVVLPSVKVGFPNTVASKLLKKGATGKTFIAKQPIWTEAGELGPDSDPPHPLAKPGLKSKTYRLEAKATSWSKDVFAEGNAVIRTYDTTTQNHANTVGLVLPDQKAADLADPTKTLKLPKECEFLTKFQGGSNTVQGTPADWSRMRNRWSVTGGTTVQHQFPGDAAPRSALQFSANVGGRSIPVFVPRTGTSDAGQQVATPNQIARMLAVLPPAQFGSVQSVQVSPLPSPDDPHWKVEYKDPNFVSGASAGNPITFYPGGGHDQEWLDSTIIHETGHNLQGSTWAADPTADATWRAARAADPQAPSGYAASSYAGSTKPGQPGSIAEDFAEMAVLYSLAKNTPCEAFMRRIYPNRCQAIDKIVRPKPPASPTILK